MIAVGFLSDLMQWLSAKGTDAQVLLGAVFSLNMGLTILKKFVDELNQRLLTAITAKIAAARNAGWLGDLSVIEDVSSAGFRSAVRCLVIERDDLEAQPPKFLVFTTFVAKTLMLLCASTALVCMAAPCTNRWTILLALPYPVYVVVLKIYEWKRRVAFWQLGRNVKREYDKLSPEDRKLIEDSRYSQSDIDKKLRTAKVRKCKTKAKSPMP